MRAPLFLLRINGERLPEWMRRRCTQFEYEGIADKMNRVQLKFKNTDLKLLDNELLDEEKGNLLRFQFGYADGQLTKPKEYVIQANEGLKQITITAFQQKSKMSSQSRTTTYEQVKRSDVAIQAAKRNGLAYQVEDTGVVFSQIVQSNETDNKFLKQMADKIGFEYYVENETLHFHSKDFGLKPVRKYKYYPNDDERAKAKLRDITPKARNVSKPSQTTKKGFDPYEGKEYEAKSNKDNVERTTAGEGTYLYNPESGNESYIPGKVETSEHPKQAQAKEETDGEFKKTEEKTVTADGDFEGDPAVLEKQLIEINNLGKKYSGLYRVKRARHIITAGSGVAYSMRLDLSKNAYHKGGKDTGAKVNKKKAPEEGEPQKTKMYVYNPDTGEESVKYV